MPAGDLNDGSRFGLVAIGLPQSNLSTPGSDTERRAMPGLATKNSVFAWSGATALPLLATRVAATGATSDTINLRSNAAPGGVSVDVPTWAAGAVIQMYTFVDTMGTSTYHRFTLETPIGSTTGLPNGTIVRSVVRTAASVIAEWDQAITPFFDEPVIAIDHVTNGTGTSTFEVRLLGFVRNV